MHAGVRRKWHHEERAKECEGKHCGCESTQGEMVSDWRRRRGRWN